ncbi:hypothetical protein JOE58_002422 [Curtobacterium luteum]|uniref:Secreted protein n=1 Tax=Curtobacterium luteum TaxID=33881 RepID=A0A8H9G8J4_9MICO|nr:MULTISPECIES: hypothetical protein [Curtobacterium]MBM7803171.1 hypothetical protein [Curtobacterium luteum]NUU50820.1 hypothetical protein [Curtobacterium luteum]GGK94682.1 hypothetical protein GCM10009769_10800 [Curtobacterium luteum]
MTRIHSRFVAALVLTLAVSGVLVGCSASPVYGPTAGCLPRFTVTPGTVRAGDTVMFATDDECDVHVPDGGWRIEVQHGGENVPEDTAFADAARSDDAFDGSWSVSVPVPSDIEPGDASVSIANWDYAPCPDDASCAGPSQSFTVAR